MDNLRKYGNVPYRIALIHGGPGAAGEMAQVARELSNDFGILEPIQTANTINGQIEELKNVLEKHSDFPVILLGYSWGAWLSFIFAARYPERIKKLILVSAGPFEQKYADKIMETRLSRMNEDEKSQAAALFENLQNTKTENKNRIFAKLGKLISKSDTFDSIENSDELIECRYDIFQNVWKQADQMRKSGELLKLAEKIKCPVIAIHGNYDPHPAEGVQIPLSGRIKEFRFILLEKCGHKPWIEKHAKDKFYKILKQEF